MALNKEKILKYLKNNVTVHIYESIDSTNNEAKRREENGCSLYATTHQTAGRGRRGHSFYSPKDTGLYMTLSLPVSQNIADVQKITCAAAVAVCTACEKLGASDLQIKWVNDIFIGNKKAAGILTELLTDGKNRPTAVIIGIGINLMTAEFPDEFASKAGSLGNLDADRLCAAITDELIEEYKGLDNNSFLEEYKRRNLCLNREVSFTLPDGEHTAAAVDISADGGLIVIENGKSLTLNSGEISVKL